MVSFPYISIKNKKTAVSQRETAVSNAKLNNFYFNSLSISLENSSLVSPLIIFPFRKNVGDLTPSSSPLEYRNFLRHIYFDQGSFQTYHHQTLEISNRFFQVFWCQLVIIKHIIMQFQKYYFLIRTKPCYCSTFCLL